jgi:arylsulfatase A-like enzyme
MAIFALLIWLLVVPIFGANGAQIPAKPNIVIFLTDDHGQKDSSVYGSKDIRTPQMQRLADAGLTFTCAYVASPSCAPSRAALLTGLMPARNGAEPNHSKPRREIKKWPSYFQELGYEVAAFGKVAHYKQTADYGFDHFGYDTFHDHAGIPAAAEFLKTRDRSKPLCLFVGTNWPHVPWPEKAPSYKPNELTLPAGSIDTPETREWLARYAEAVSTADHDLGVVLDAAHATLSENTITVMSGDHGAQWPFAKWNCYEAGVCVPLIMSWPGVVQPGTRSAAMVSWIDLLPTLLEGVGGTPPPDIDGRSFLPVLLGKRSEHRERIFTTHSGDGTWNVYPSGQSAMATGSTSGISHPEFAFTTHIDLPGNLAPARLLSDVEAALKNHLEAAAIVEALPRTTRRGAL